MPAEPLLHERSRQALETIVKTRPHAILLHGPKGIGLNAIAHWLASRLAHTQVHITDIHPEKTGITIDQIRDLYAITRSKSESRRVIILHQTELMAESAQTAFLKLLEEPTKRTTFVLLSHSPEILLPTIRSRTQELALHPLAPAQTATLLDDLGVADKKLRSQLQFVADGLVEELDKLAKDEPYRRSQFAYVTIAKQLLSGTLFERLQLITPLSSDRQATQTTLWLITRILSSEVARQPSSTAILAKLDATLKTIDRLSSNGNVKIQLLRLILDV